jgi:class 3 adenylate cyclase
MYLDSVVAYGNTKDVLIHAYLRKSELYSQQGEFEKARYCLQQAIDLEPTEGPSLHLMATLGNLLCETGHADSALIVYSSFFERFKTLREFDDRFKSYNHAMIAKCYMRLKNYKLAIKSGETGLKLALDKQMKKERLDNLAMLYEIYVDKKDFQNALRYFKMHREYADSMNFDILRSSEARYDERVRAERSLSQIKLLEQENENQKLVRNGFVGGFAAVLFFAGVFFRQRNRTQKEKKKSDDLLLNILPSEVAEELKEKGNSKARLFDDVTVMFTDFVDFTLAAERMSAEELVGELHNCFKAFDEIISRHTIEKIKTIGDAYLAVSGLPNADEQHARNAVQAAIEIRQFMSIRRQELGDRTFEIRIGLHSGPVVAGIVGVKKFAYDIWGDTVNTAARMEQNSSPGRINVSESTYESIRDSFECSYRGEISAKNKGKMKMYFVEEPARQYQSV